MVVDVENGKGHVKVEEIQTKRGGLKNEILIPPSLHTHTHQHRQGRSVIRVANLCCAGEERIINEVRIVTFHP